MQQQELFPIHEYHLVYKSEKGHAKKWRLQSVTVYDDSGFPIIFVHAETVRTHPRKSDVLNLARMALRQMDLRPFGDEYSHPDGEVAYLVENVK